MFGSAVWITFPRFLRFCSSIPLVLAVLHLRLPRSSRLVLACLPPPYGSGYALRCSSTHGSHVGLLQLRCGSYRLGYCVLWFLRSRLRSARTCTYLDFTFTRFTVVRFGRFHRYILCRVAVRRTCLHRSGSAARLRLRLHTRLICRVPLHTVLGYHTTGCYGCGWLPVPLWLGLFTLPHTAVATARFYTVYWMDSQFATLLPTAHAVTLRYHCPVRFFTTHRLRCCRGWLYCRTYTDTFALHPVVLHVLTVAVRFWFTVRLRVRTPLPAGFWLLIPACYFAVHCSCGYSCCLPVWLRFTYRTLLRITRLDYCRLVRFVAVYACLRFPVADLHGCYTPRVYRTCGYTHTVLHLHARTRGLHIRCLVLHTRYLVIYAVVVTFFTLRLRIATPRAHLFAFCDYGSHNLHAPLYRTAYAAAVWFALRGSRLPHVAWFTAHLRLQHTPGSRVYRLDFVPLLRRMTGSRRRTLRGCPYLPTLDVAHGSGSVCTCRILVRLLRFTFAHTVACRARFCRAAPHILRVAVGCRLPHSYLPLLVAYTVVVLTLLPVLPGLLRSRVCGCVLVPCHVTLVALLVRCRSCTHWFVLPVTAFPVALPVLPGLPRCCWLHAAPHTRLRFGYLPLLRLPVYLQLLLVTYLPRLVAVYAARLLVTLLRSAVHRLHIRLFWFAYRLRFPAHTTRTAPLYLLHTYSCVVLLPRFVRFAALRLPHLVCYRIRVHRTVAVVTCLRLVLVLCGYHAVLTAAVLPRLRHLLVL